MDTRTLNATQKAKLAAAYDAVEKKDLQAFPKMGSDPVRRETDEALGDALALSSLAPLREMLGREPVVTLKAL